MSRVIVACVLIMLWGVRRCRGGRKGLKGRGGWGVVVMSGMIVVQSVFKLRHACRNAYAQQKNQRQFNAVVIVKLKLG